MRAPANRAGGFEAQVLTLLGPAPISEDRLNFQLGRPAQDVLAAVKELDLAGKVLRHPGTLVSQAVG